MTNTSGRLETMCVDGGFFVEATAEVAEGGEWVVAPALIEAMMAGRPLMLDCPIAPVLGRRLDLIQGIYTAWIPGAKPIGIQWAPSREKRLSGATSVFFSGGVDSFYSLMRHKEEIDNLILVHGFDVPLADTARFSKVEASVREAADPLQKRVVVARTNLHFERAMPCGWPMYHGAAIAAVGHALAAVNGTIYIGSTFSWDSLHAWGSHPLLDPLWSTESVRFVHDGCEANRVAKLRYLKEFPDILERLRVCWANTGDYNCGTCEKCLRTMLALYGLGVKRCRAFPDSLNSKLVRSQVLGPGDVLFWRELLALDLGALGPAVRSAIRSAEAGLPPRNGKVGREIRRTISALRKIGGIAQAWIGN